MIESQGLPRRIYGVDFSGAKDAGKKIWIASGIIKEGVLHIEKCERGKDSLGTDRLDACLRSLRDFIASEKDCAFGLDFPFGLPKKLVKESSWEDFVRHFPENYPNLKKFRDACKIYHEPELKRTTDIKSKTPFSPYNLRIYYQTYYGIHDILYPLVSADQARILPMQNVENGKTIVIEICPASTLKKLWHPGKPLSYKHNTDTHFEAREQIIDKLNTNISIPGSIRTIALNNAGGDALDSIIAAYSTFCASRKNFTVKDGKNYCLEGYVFA
ncbi:MAG: DUF429 domain-containing protein [Candidatus Methanoperedens sp.]|nr:DUF429 domain-containing protein [Candidatus Methanoperedens sp.]